MVTLQETYTTDVRNLALMMEVLINHKQWDVNYLIYVNVTYGESTFWTMPYQAITYFAKNNALAQVIGRDNTKSDSSARFKFVRSVGWSW